MKKYENLSESKNRGVIAIPHERQAIVLFKCILENKQLFQSLNDCFWDEYINPIFVEKGKRKLNIGPILLMDQKSGFSRPYHITNLSGKNIEVGNTLVVGKDIPFQEQIFDLIASEFVRKNTCGEFEIETFTYAFFLFVCSDLNNAMKYLSKKGIKSSKIFNLPLIGIEGNKDNNRIDNPIVEFNDIIFSWGFDTWKAGYSSSSSLRIAALISRDFFAFEYATDLICKELKTSNFYSSFLADGFLSWVVKNRKTDLNIPKRVENKIQLMVWKNIAKKTKITKKSFYNLIDFNGIWKPHNRIDYFKVEAFDFLLSVDEKLNERGYFNNLMDEINYKLRLEDFEKCKTLNFFWFEWVLSNRLHREGSWRWEDKTHLIKLKNILDLIFVKLSDADKEDQNNIENIELYHRFCLFCERGDAKSSETLMRVEGVGEELAEALIEVGITTVKALAELSIDELFRVQVMDNEKASGVIMAARENE